MTLSPAATAELHAELGNIKAAAASRLDLPSLIDADHLDDRQALAVLHWWHQATGGLAFSASWVGTVGVRAYHWQRAMAGSDARGVDGVRRITSPLAAAMTADMALHLDWLDPEDMADWLPADLHQLYLTELDVNGQFLSAAGIELGTDEPDLIRRPRTLDAYLRMPGYVRLAEKPDLFNVRPTSERIPALSCPLAFDRLDAERVIAMPTADYLTRKGVHLNASEIVIWPRHRRHLASWAALFRSARSTLALHVATYGNLAARVALGLVKEVANVTVGGWMRSEDKNPSDLMRKDWSDMIISESVIRALIALDKAAAAGIPALGMRRDAAWFIGRRDLEPEGLVIDKTLYPNGKDGQLGKWKRTRSVPIDSRLIEAVRTGSPEMVVRVLTSWDRETKGQV
jgi:hypothetical protein